MTQSRDAGFIALAHGSPKILENIVSVPDFSVTTTVGDMSSSDQFNIVPALLRFKY